MQRGMALVWGLLLALAAVARATTPLPSEETALAIYAQNGSATTLIYQRLGASAAPAFAVATSAKAQPSDCLFLTAVTDSYDSSAVDGSLYYCVQTYDIYYDGYYGDGPDMVDEVEHYQTWVPGALNPVTLPEGYVVCPAYTFAEFSYQAYYSREEGSDWLTVVINAAMFNPYVALCYEELSLDPAQVPWMPSGLVASINCTSDQHFVGGPRVDTDIFAVTAYFLGEGFTLNATEITDWDALETEWDYWNGPDGYLYEITSYIYGISDYSFGLQSTYETPLFMVDVYVAHRHMYHDVNIVFYVRYRNILLDYPGKARLPYMVDVVHEGRFPWIAADTAFDGGIGNDMVVVPLEDLFADPELPASVGFYTQFLAARNFDRNVFDLLGLPDADLPPFRSAYDGQLALKLLDFQTDDQGYDYNMNNDNTWGYFTNQLMEVCSAMLPAFATDLGLVSNLMVLDPDANIGVRQSLDYNRTAMGILVDEYLYRQSEAVDFFCYYMVYPLAANDFAAGGTPDAFGIPFRQRPYTVLKVRFSGDWSAYSARIADSFLIDTVYQGNNGVSALVVGNTTFSGAVIAVNLTDVVYDSGPIPCNTVVQHMYDSVRANLPYLQQYCGADAVFDPICAQLTALVNSGALTAPVNLPAHTVCPQVVIDPQLVAQATTYAYFFNLTTGVVPRHTGTLNLLIALVGYDQDKLCGYSRRVNFDAYSWPVFPFSITNYRVNTTSALGDLNNRVSRIVNIQGCGALQWDQFGCTSDAPNRFYVQADPTDAYISYEGTIEADYVWHVPVTGVAHGVVDTFLNCTEEDMRNFATGLFDSNSVAMDPCQTSALVAVFVCEGDVACIDASTFTNCSDPAPATQQAKVQLSLAGVTPAVLQAQSFTGTKYMLSITGSLLAATFLLPVLLL